jgi:hypothetical protein
MALSNTYDTTNPGSAVSNREDLTDAYSVLAPQSTPVLSLAKKTKANGRFHEWTVDKLDTPSTTAIAEGTDVSAYTDKFAGMARLGNYVHERRRDYMVSTRQQAVDGVLADMLAEAEVKCTKEIKRDIEAIICGTQDRANEDGAGTASTARGLGDWIDSAGPADVHADYRTPAASIHASGSFTETVLRGMITSRFRTNGEINSSVLVADTALRAAIADFSLTSGDTDIVYRNVNQPSVDGLKLMVGTYETDHGLLSIINMNPACAPDTTNKDTGYLIDTDFIAVADLIPLGSQRAPNLGAGERGWVDWTGTLVVKHPAAFGKVTTLS